MSSADIELLKEDVTGILPETEDLGEIFVQLLNDIINRLDTLEHDLLEAKHNCNSNFLTLQTAHNVQDTRIALLEVALARKISKNTIKVRQQPKI